MHGRLEIEADAPGQRGEPRRRLFMSGNASQTGTTCEVVVHNLSTTGMLLSTDGHFDLDEPLEVVIAEAGNRLARIVWSADGLYGCRFDEDLTKAQVSAMLLRSDPVPSPAVGSPETASGDETFGARLKRLRQGTGLSMVEFGNLFGVTKPTLWKWETERARPRMAVLRALAAHFGMTEQELLYGRRDGEVRASAGQRPERPAGTLTEVVARSRKEIAGAAGVPTRQVSIAIEWN